MLPAEEVDVYPGHSVVMIATSPVSTCPAQQLMLLPGTAHVTLNLKFYEISLKQPCSSDACSFTHMFFVP